LTNITGIERKKPAFIDSPLNGNELKEMFKEPDDDLSVPAGEELHRELLRQDHESSPPYFGAPRL